MATIQGWGRQTWNSGAWNTFAPVEATGNGLTSSVGSVSTVTTNIFGVTGIQLTSSIGDAAQASEYATTGNAIEFGTMSNPVSSSMAGASRTRAVWFAGNQPGAPHSPYIQKIEFASTGNSVNFGTMDEARWGGGTCSNGIRAVTAGGSNSGDENNGNNWIEYITISEGGTGQDFGDLSTSGVYVNGVSSPTRGVLYTGKIGSSPSTSNSNTIQYVTIATTGNASDFGDVASGSFGAFAALESPTRGILAGGFNNTPSPYPCGEDGHVRCVPDMKGQEIDYDDYLRYPFQLPNVLAHVKETGTIINSNGNPYSMPLERYYGIYLDKRIVNPYHNPEGIRNVNHDALDFIIEKLIANDIEILFEPTPS